MSEEDKKEDVAAEQSAQTESSQAETKKPQAEVIKGKVKWFSNVKGFGFLEAEGQEKDIFVHYSVIQGEGYKTLKDSEEVSFEVTTGPKGPLAANVQRVKKEKKEAGKS